MLKKLAFIAALAVTAAPIWAHEYTVGDLEISHPHAFETPPMAMTGGGFMSITNSGAAADRLIAVRADFPRVELHQSVLTDGVGKMLSFEGIDIAPGETVLLQPGGYHVMFIGLAGRQFKEGEKIAATLVFEQAGDLAVEFSVEKRPVGMGMGMKMDHGKMQMNGMSGN
ncbi:MAG: copper chaperone PCu(A)C [Rhodobacterales bacterium]|nr:copper chaperone PCu(A)C [Rhodobacterales bacterium]NCO85057.1 copper chaperone PCu(A)C [Rhodobacterales bacterium]